MEFTLHFSRRMEARVIWTELETHSCSEEIGVGLNALIGVIHVSSNTI